MAIRSARERIRQTLAYEAGGLALAAPLYGLVFGQSAQDSFLLMASLSLAVMLWTPLHNTLFDILDFKMTGRLASDRPQGLRVVQALSMEASALLVTLPLIMALSGFGLAQALMAELGLTLFYAAYGYIFHIVFDRLRPVAPALQPLPFRANSGDRHVFSN